MGGVFKLIIVGHWDNNIHFFSTLVLIATLRPIVLLVIPQLHLGAGGGVWVRVRCGI